MTLDIAAKARAELHYTVTTHTGSHVGLWADKETAHRIADGYHTQAFVTEMVPLSSLKTSESARVKAEQERDAYRSKLMQLADATEVSGMSWSGFNVLGDKKSIKAVQSAVHYAGQIEEYRKAFADRLKQVEAERDALKAELEWYGEQARLARLIHSEGDKGRHALQDDGGKRARRALEASK